MGSIIAIISGICMSIQGIFNTNLVKEAGMWTSMSWVHFSALLFNVLMCLITGENHINKIVSFQPRYMLLSGVIGAVISYTVVKAIEYLGPAKAAILIVISQIVMAYLIELLGIFYVEKTIFQWKKIVGIVIAVIGIFIFQWE